MSSPEQLLRELARSASPPTVVEVRVVQVDAHAQLGALVLCESVPGGREVELVPMWPARCLTPIRAGDHGLALLASGDPSRGYYLAGVPVSGAFPEWDGLASVIDARGDLHVDAEGDVVVLDGTRGAAREGDAVEVTVDLSDAVALQRLAAALLTTGAFLPTGSPPLPASAVTSFSFQGVIAEGSARVKVGG